MKVLVINSDVMLHRENLHRITEQIAEEYKRQGTVTVPCGFTYEVVDVDFGYVKFKDKEREEKMAAANIPMYVDYVYEIIKADCAGLGSIYEEYIRNQVGTIGLNALLENHLLMDCGMEYGKQKYALVVKES